MIARIQAGSRSGNSGLQRSISGSHRRTECISQSGGCSDARGCLSSGAPVAATASQTANRSRLSRAEGLLHAPSSNSCKLRQDCDDAYSVQSETNADTYSQGFDCSSFVVDHDPPLL